MKRFFWLCGAVVLTTAAHGAPPLDKEALRKTRSADLTPTIERVVLPNGLTVLLSPVPQASTVVVDVSFFAGAQFEPPGKGGLAHLVEHVMSCGRTPDTDYQSLLEARGAADFNAFTSADLMTFHVVVPPHELPLALWAAADRLLAIPPTIDDAEFDRHRRIVIEERAVRIDDAAYMSAQQALYHQMFPSPHPLHSMVIGSPQELAALTVADAKAFIERCLVPANAIVTLSGNFSAAAAREQVRSTLGRLPSGARLPLPQTPPRVAGKVVTVPEPRARKPRVTFAWRFGELPVDAASTLDFGAMLVMAYTDGTLGMDVGADYQPFLGGSTFYFDVTLAHEASRNDARNSAEALLRYLTRATAEDAIFGAALLAKDRAQMSALDDPSARATMLTHWEYLVGTGEALARHNERHWSLLPWEIAPVARQWLDRDRFTLHARPLNPLPRRGPRE